MKANFLRSLSEDFTRVTRVTQRSNKNTDYQAPMSKFYSALLSRAYGKHRIWNWNWNRSAFIHILI